LLENDYSMQDIDFNKILAKKNFRDPVKEKRKFSKNTRNEKRKNSIIMLALSAAVFFALGMISGKKWQKYMYTQTIEKNTLSPENTSIVETANINPEVEKSNLISKEKPTEDETVSKSETENEIIETLQQESDESFLILCRKYKSKKEAQRDGLKLLDIGVRPLLTEDGSRMKMYAGPISGKQKAYQIFAKIKKIPEFRGAILYPRKK